MTAWDVRVSPLTVGRGESLTVEVGNVERFRNVRVELLLVERKLKAQFDIKQNHSRVVETVAVAPGETAIELIVPAWVPDTYSGETVGWDYEVRVVGDDLGPDPHRIVPVVIDGGAPVDTDAGSGAWLIIAMIA